MRLPIRVDAVVAPFVGIALLAFAAAGMQTAGTDWRLLADAATAAVVLSLAGAGLRGSRWPLVLALAVGADGLIALLRQAQGGSVSGYGPLAVLPVAWVGLTLGRRAVLVISGCTCLLFGLPIAIFGAPMYPGTGWRGVVLWTVVAVVLGIGANRVVAYQRRQAALLRSRSLAFDRLVEAQTLVATADCDAAGLMEIAVEQALTLAGADGACIELLDGDEVVCNTAAGAGVDYVGLRVRANASLSGECFRTGETLVCSDSESDSRAAREGCRAVGARSLILLPIRHTDDVKAVLVVWSADPGDFGGYESQLLAVLATMTGSALVRAELITRLTGQADTDELTGLPNRRAWYQHLDQALARARRSHQPLTVLILDLDDFKQVNDQQGHTAGDRLLKTVSSCWTTVLRSTDLLGRIGGDEFAVILENTDGSAALEIINRLDQSLNQQHHASTGMAVWNPEEDAASLITRADSNMYIDKRTRTRRVSHRPGKPTHGKSPSQT